MCLAPMLLFLTWSYCIAKLFRLSGQNHRACAVWKVWWSGSLLGKYSDHNIQDAFWCFTQVNKEPDKKYCICPGDVYLHKVTQLQRKTDLSFCPSGSWTLHFCLHTSWHSSLVHHSHTELCWIQGCRANLAEWECWWPWSPERCLRHRCAEGDLLSQLCAWGWIAKFSERNKQLDA